MSLKSGLTWRSLFGLIIAALLFLPVNIYLNLSTGMMISTAAVYIIAILLSEIARYSGNPLSAHELFIIYATMGIAATTLPPYYWLVYRSFFVNTPVTYAYKIDDTPLPYLVEDWLCPPLGSPAHTYRTLFQVEWLKPLAIFTTLSLLSFTADLGLSMFLSHLTVRVVGLRFPFATLDWSLIETITKRESDKIKIFMTGFYPGLIYGAILYGGFGMGVPLIPLPWADFTWLTEKYLPGAIVGISTEPSPFIFGLMLPLSITGNILAGSLIIWIILNYIFTTNTSFFPQWVKEYYRGMTISSIYQRSFQRIWISPQFGFVIGLAIALIISLRKHISGIVRLRLKDVKNEFNDFPSIKLSLVLYVIGSVGSVLLFIVLVPEIPFYVPLLTSLAVSFMIGALAAYAIGEVGTFPSLPWPWQAIIYFTPYKGYPGWVVSPYICLGTPGSASQMVKVSYLSGTKPKDYFKAWTIALILNLIFGLIVIDTYWRLAPIPSSVYPGSMIYWPIYATNDALFATRQIKLDPTLLSLSSLISCLLYFASNVLQKIGIPFHAIAFIMGCYTLPTSSIMMFIGSLISHYALARYFGRERWISIRGIFSAGLFAGVGIFLGVGIALTLLTKAAWVWPW
ncbi:MAG: hypothetical protein QXK24_03185 [Ignisphaera sp.]